MLVTHVIINSDVDGVGISSPAPVHPALHRTPVTLSRPANFMNLGYGCKGGHCTFLEEEEDKRGVASLLVLYFSSSAKALRPVQRAG